MLSRENLPQIPEDELDNFREYMHGQEIESKYIKISPSDLKPVQKHLNKEKVKKIYDDGEVSTPCIISNDNFLLDGHHRWAADLLIDKDKKIVCLQFNCSIYKLIKLGHLFDGSFVKSVSESTTYII